MKMEVEGTKKYKFMSEDGDHEIALIFDIQYWIFPDQACYFFNCMTPFDSQMPLMCFTLDSIDAEQIRNEIDRFISDDIEVYADRPDSELYKDSLLLKRWLNSCVRLRMEEKHE